jgi:phosphatidylglycerophosphate synthase
MAITWTSAFGQACGWLLNHIVHGLALTRISPNALTFIGLVINIVAAFLFGHANETNAGRMFFYAGLVIFSAGLFDMVDGRVARRNNQVTVFGSFFDSVIDRYSDVVLFFGLLVYYGRINRFRYVVLVAFVMVTSLMVSYTRARRGPHRAVQGRLHGASRADCPDHPGRLVQPLGRHGPGALGAGRALHHHRCPPHYLHLPEHQAPGAADLICTST